MIYRLADSSQTAPIFQNIGSDLLNRITSLFGSVPQKENDFDPELNFRIQAMRCLEGASPRSTSLPTYSFTDEQLDAITSLFALSLWNRGDERSFPSDLTHDALLFVGEKHKCLISEKMAGVLFKQSREINNDDASAYLDYAQKARAVCKEYSLNLLYMPDCQPAHFDESVIVEEKIELLPRESLESYYQWALHDPDLQPYMKKLFQQLTIFVCRMNIPEMTYNNLPFTKDGRVALFRLAHLDRRSVDGLTFIFNTIPLEWFYDFKDLAINHLKKDALDWLNRTNYFQLARNTQKELKLAEVKKQAELAAFYSSRKISKPEQKLRLPSEDTLTDTVAVCKDATIVNVALLILKQLNLHIEAQATISLITGRVVLLSPLTEPLGEELRLISTKRPLELMKEALNLLKLGKYIFSYEQHPSHFRVTY